MSLKTIVADRPKTVNTKFGQIEILAVPPVLNIDGVTTFFPFKRRKVYRLIKAKKFKNASKTGKEWNIPTSDILKYLKANVVNNSMEDEEADNGAQCGVRNTAGVHS